MSPRPPANGNQYRVLVVDDGFWGREQVVPRLQRLRMFCDSVSHMRAEDGPSWAEYDIVLLDAYDDIGLRHDPLRTRLAALPLLRSAEDRWGVGLRVVVYSTEIQSPYIRVPLLQTGRVCEFRSAAEVIDSDVLLQLVTSETRSISPVPSNTDWAAMGLPEGAKIGDAHETVRLNRPDVWRLVLDEIPKPLGNDADRKWIKRNVNSLLGLDARWSQVRSVLRRVARG